MPVTTIQVAPFCYYAVRTTNGDPNTTTDGRLNGNRIDFTKINYYDYSMRRKAEVLKYKQTDTNTTKKQFSNIVNNGGTYSQATIQKIISLRVKEDCPLKITPSSNIGVNDNNNTAYYLDVNVPYRSGL
jgi:hypothetical protein